MSALPVFEAPLTLVELLVSDSRERFGPRGLEGEPAAPVELDEEVSPEPEELSLCSKRLHDMTPENTANNGACKACAKVTRKRKRGEPVCWTGEHEEPEEGLICECGEPQPATDFLDWAQVEAAVNGDPLDRPMTNAETVSALRTLEARLPYSPGPFEAGQMLGVPPHRVRYLMYEWEGDRGTPDARGAFLAEVSA